MEMDKEPETVGSALTKSSQGPVSQSSKTSNAERGQAITLMLVKLSAHYWRPDFSEGQARQLIADFIHDLAPFELEDIDRAITRYRSDPANRFFPHPGALIGILKPTEDKTPVRHALGKFDYERFKSWPPADKRATKTAAQILAEHAA